MQHDFKGKKVLNLEVQDDLRRKSTKRKAHDHKKYLLLSTRYLDAYEKYYFLGEEEEEDSNLFYDEEDQRQRRQRALRIVQSVPSTYNEGQHRIAGTCVFFAALM